MQKAAQRRAAHTDEWEGSIAKASKATCMYKILLIGVKQLAYVN